MLNCRHLRTGSKRRTGPLLLQRGIAIGLAVFLALPCGGSAVAFAQQAAPAQPAGGVSSSQSGSQNPDTGNAIPVPEAAPPSNGRPPSNAPQATQPQQNSGTPAPVGTAVAPYEKGMGIAASRPAGAVIAPAKQRRSRSFAIKVSLLIGAAVAVGTVVALSNASPSRPQLR
jgi:hypothetical protein